MMLFFAPQAWPFLFAATLLLAIALIEGLALLLGFSVSAWFDSMLPDTASFDGPGGIFDSWLGWLHLGKVPLLVVLVILLTAFSFIGFLANGVFRGIAGFYMPVYVSVPLAFLMALPIVRAFASGIARFIPRDETSAESLDNLVGRIAVVVNGTAKKGYPAQARVRNDHGQSLYVHVEPDDEGLEFVTGNSVLLVKQVSGARFFAIPNPRPDLL